MTLEIGSHSINHKSLFSKSPLDVISTIEKSITLFKEEGIPVCGFRAPYLSTELMYFDILKGFDRQGPVIKYDSSTLFEGNLFSSRVHDLLYLKPPHDIADIWELPISCLDDHHLFTKLERSEEFVCEYWKRKVDINIRKYNYFLLLIHPDVIGNHLLVIEHLLAYCEQRYLTTSFTTCVGLVQELNLLKKKRSNLRNENMHDI